jgi:hypothetical protein
VADTQPWALEEIPNTSNRKTADRRLNNFSKAIKMRNNKLQSSSLKQPKTAMLFS